MLVYLVSINSYPGLSYLRSKISTFNGNFREFFTKVKFKVSELTARNVVTYVKIDAESDGVDGICIRRLVFEI